MRFPSVTASYGLRTSRVLPRHDVDSRVGTNDETNCVAGTELLGNFRARCSVWRGVALRLVDRPSIQLLSLATLANSGQDAYITYRYGNYSAAREALLKHVEVLRTTGPSDGAQAQSVDIVLSYGRLAILAEKVGNTADGQEFWQRALESRAFAEHPATQEEVRQTIQFRRMW